MAFDETTYEGRKAAWLNEGETTEDAETFARLGIRVSDSDLYSCEFE